MPKLFQSNQDYFIVSDNIKNYKFINNKAIANHIKSRATRLFTKEPETISWIKSFNEGSVFFDIGANIGIYTIYGAVSKNISTYSFEPHAANYKNLIENINANNLKKSYAYPLAVGKKFNLSSMFVKNMIEGVADNVVDNTGDVYHGVVTVSLDQLIEDKMVPQPDYIKIDVDGYEDKVFQGCANAIKNCKSLLIEIDIKHIRLKEQIQALGLTLISENVRNEFEKNYIFFSERR